MYAAPAVADITARLPVEHGSCLAGMAITASGATSGALSAIYAVKRRAQAAQRCHGEAELFRGGKRFGVSFEQACEGFAWHVSPIFVKAFDARERFPAAHAALLATSKLRARSRFDAVLSDDAADRTGDACAPLKE